MNRRPSRRRPPVTQRGSSSLRRPDYWWYGARARLLEVALGPFLGDPALLLDVGSADGPSVGWMHRGGRRVALDLVPEGLRPGEGVCGSATALPFPDETFEAVGAFDVVEHCEDDRLALAELARVLTPGGRLLLSVPAYQWAWTDHDVRAGHYRRYTRPGIVGVVEGAGLRVHRSTYAFCAVFPFFAADRLRRRIRGRLGPGDPQEQRLPESPAAVDRTLARLSRLDAAVLRRADLPFGSSVFVAATKPGR